MSKILAGAFFAVITSSLLPLTTTWKETGLWVLGREVAHMANLCTLKNGGTMEDIADIRRKFTQALRRGKHSWISSDLDPAYGCWGDL